MKPTTRGHHVVWSAVSCPFRRAGVYYGLSSAHTHHAAAQLVLPRRAQVYTGATVQVRPGEQPCPLTFFAVRDPSAVRVVPVPPSHAGRGEPHADHFGGEHVSLIFEPGRRPERPGSGTLDHSALTHLCQFADPAAHAVFVVSIGLRTDLERRFFDEVVIAPTCGTYAQICERISAVKDTFCE